VRRFSDEVHVRCGPLGGLDDAPVQFVWRGRLYLVREVLSRWRERSAWWEQSAVAAVHGDDHLQELGGPGGGGGGAGTVTAVRRVLELGDLEREVWRVEAGIGRGRVLGVYDLARRVSPGTAAVSEVAGTPAQDGSTPDGPAWQMLRVSD
jgi:hypothetical protein